MYKGVKLRKPLLGFPVDCSKRNQYEVESLQSIGNALGRVRLYYRNAHALQSPDSGGKQNLTRESGGNRA